MNRSRGAVMVELVLLTPLLVLLVFGIAELGRALYQQNTLAKAVVSGARYLGRAAEVLDHGDCTELAPWGDAVAKAKNLIVYGNEQGSGEPLLVNLSLDDVLVDADHVPPGGLGEFPGACVIRISATAEFDIFLFPILGLESPFPALNAAAQERWIGE